MPKSIYLQRERTRVPFFFKPKKSKPPATGHPFQQKVTPWVWAHPPATQFGRSSAPQGSLTMLSHLGETTYLPPTPTPYQSLSLFVDDTRTMSQGSSFWLPFKYPPPQSQFLFMIPAQCHKGLFQPTDPTKKTLPKRLPNNPSPGSRCLTTPTQT